MADQEAADQNMDQELLDYGEQGAEAEQADAAAEPADPEAEQQQQQDAEAEAEDNGAAAPQHMEQDKPAEAAATAANEVAAKNPNDPMSQPPHGTEVYMSNLAMDASDEQIRAFCQQMGEVFQLRLPKNPDGRNRGYGFVVYTTKTAAENAVQHLNAQELPDYPGRKVRVNESQVKNKLYMGNLPRGMTLHQVEELLKQDLVGVEDVELMMDKENPELNRGFGFVSFYNYACAEQARRKYTEQEKTIGGRPVTVTWAEPKKEEDTSKVKAVYVGGLPDSVTEQKLIDIFKAYGEIEKVMLPYSKEDPSKYRDYGFVHFRERDSALQAISRAETEKLTLDGKELSVHMAKPQHDNTQSGYGAGRGYGQQGYGYGAGGYGSYGGGSYGRGTGRGTYGRGGGGGGRGSYGSYGTGRGRGYGAYSAAAAGGYGEEEYAEEEYAADDGYGAGGGYATGYGAAAAAAPVASGSTVMMPVQLPNGQVGYMVVPAGTAAAAGAGGPMRRGAVAAYGATGYGAAATGYAAAAGAASYGGRTGYGAGRGAGYSRGGGSGGYRSAPY